MVANGFEGVPWMVGGGAKHSANVGRLVSFLAAGGMSGVVGPGDLKVSATPGTPDGYVHMASGAVAVVNRHLNARSEAYAARAIQASDIAVASTGSSPRSDLIVVRIKDPQYGWDAPADSAAGPYAFPEVIPGVPANTVRVEQLTGLQQAIYAAARIDIPANTSAITPSMIKDLRRLATPHYEVFNALAPVTQEEDIAIGDTAWKNFPGSALATVEVPSWATHADVSIELLGMMALGDADAETRVNLGGLTGPAFYFDFNGARDPGGYKFQERVQHATQAALDVRNLAGQTVSLRLNARRIYTQHTDRIWIKPGAQVRFRVEFFERPI